LPLLERARVEVYIPDLRTSLPTFAFVFSIKPLTYAFGASHVRCKTMPSPPELSKSQIDRLGDRLRKGNISQVDLRLLDRYRRSFTEAYEAIVGRIRHQLGLEPTGRPAKSTTSIIDKLRRESIRLSQIQDIAGCRLIVKGIAAQDDVVIRLRGLGEQSTIVDRREHPSHGYRAVHVIVVFGGKLIEIQVRTSFQHAWAELSEKLSDEIGSEIKYGGGNKEVVSQLAAISDATLELELAMRGKNVKQTLARLERWSELWVALSNRLRER
jgi:putative GTP pyrophosphokinase